jgi:hypothetical protein
MSSSFFGSPDDSLANAGKRPVFQSANVWREGSQIVIAFPDFQLPPICVVTGRMENLTLEPISTAIGASIDPIARSIYQELRVPVNATWLKQKKAHFRRGVWLALAGLASACLSFFIVIFLETFIEGLTGIAIALLVLGAILGVLGFIYMMLFGSINLLLTVDCQPPYVWLGGANEDFMHALPDWKTTGPVGAPRVLPRNR